MSARKRPSLPPPPHPDEVRLQVVTWMCETGLGCSSAARAFPQLRMTGKHIEAWKQWAMRHNMWPPPGVTMAPRLGTAAACKQMREDMRKAAEEDPDTPPPPKKGLIPVENVEGKVRRKLITIRDQTLDRLEELSGKEKADAKAFNAFAQGLRSLLDKFDGLEALDATTNQRSAALERLERLKGVVSPDE